MSFMINVLCPSFVVNVWLVNTIEVRFLAGCHLVRMYVLMKSRKRWKFGNVGSEPMSTDLEIEKP